jgi:hypothetical protein
MTEERLHEIDQHIADGSGDCNGHTERALVDLVAEVRRLREQLAAIDTLHKQWVIKFLSGYERSKGVERLVDAIGKILHPQEREA